MSMSNIRISYIVLPIIAIIGALLVLPSVFSFAQTNSENCIPSRFSFSWSNTDFCNSSIVIEDVISGGPSKDGIPAIDNPNMESVDEASQWLTERSPMVVVEIDGDARAYPQSILMWHEIINDEVGGIPVAITFCPLCNSSVVFDRRVGDETLVFGVSGVLFNSNMVMFDRLTDSWWQQLTGEGIVGDYNETLLDFVPSQVIGFAQFAERYPDGLVMSLETGFSRSYGVNPYVGVDDNNSPVTSLFRDETDPRLPSRSRVLAVELDGTFMAYPFDALTAEFVINDTIVDTPVVALWQPGVASALDRSQIDASRDIGTTALYERTLEDGTVLTFAWDDETQTMIDEQTNSTWNLFGEAVDGELAGTDLRLMVAAPHFWFAWAAFNPETEVYGLE
jgi:uncharacterized protein DUF3179